MMLTPEIARRLTAYLRSWHDTSTKSKQAKGKTVTLTFDEFLSLFKPRQIKTLEKAIAANRLRYLQREDNPFALVLTWRSYTACQTDLFSSETACVCSRQMSKVRAGPQKGEALSERTKQRISEGKRGRPIDQQHKNALSEALRGKPKQAWSEERKAARRAQIADRKGN